MSDLGLPKLRHLSACSSQAYDTIYMSLLDKRLMRLSSAASTHSSYRVVVLVPASSAYTRDILCVALEPEPSHDAAASADVPLRLTAQRCVGKWELQAALQSQRGAHFVVPADRRDVSALCLIVHPGITVFEYELPAVHSTLAVLARRLAVLPAREGIEDADSDGGAGAAPAAVPLLERGPGSVPPQLAALFQLADGQLTLSDDKHIPFAHALCLLERFSELTNVPVASGDAASSSFAASAAPALARPHWLTGLQVRLSEDHAAVSDGGERPSATASSASATGRKRRRTADASDVSAAVDLNP
jgi:hypothetical protein